ncbi:MAG: Rne/Rng family ribonuclease [Candidatus Dadabacteria bacterium]|nr:MAG: Rne/Rng family ribonuclease [Candidatus Dadabacteria bacterium]
MDRRMLINSVHPEECRIAIIEGTNLLELELESGSATKLKGNVYKAKISRIEPSLQAAFLDIGTERNGFLQINDIHPSYFRGDPKHLSNFSGKVNIQDVLEPGQELVVQVVKEERELKGATLTTYISLPGRYVVLMPGSDRGGVSRKIVDSEQRGRLRKLANELEMPLGIGLIIRTAGLDRSQSELSRDLSLQLKLWERIVSAAQDAPCPTVLYQESDLATRVIRDYFAPDIREIIIDDSDTYKRVKEFVAQVMPRYRSRVKLYEHKEPIFSHYKVEEQVIQTFDSEVKLKSGGAIVIDALEALVAIDVNSAKATAGGSIEETAYRTNLEAAEEIARQLRLRDLGGLIVIDFIDMIDRRNRAAVEKRLREAVKSDKARIEIGRFSKFGLLEMSRQRLRASLSSQSHMKCPACRGAGKLKRPQVVALEALRKIQSAVIVGGVGVVKARLSPAAALFMLNNKKAELAKLEEEYKVQIYILADGRMRSDEYQFEMESKKSDRIPATRQTELDSQQEGYHTEEEEEEGDEDDDRYPTHENAGADTDIEEHQPAEETSVEAHEEAESEPAQKSSAIQPS